MKSLKSILEASILADIDDQMESGDIFIRDQILEYINVNYNIKGKLTISDEPNKYGKYEVSALNVQIKGNKMETMTAFTNNMFEWSVIKDNFECGSCCSLKSLEGAPKQVGGYFSCRYCDSLTSLEGAPEKVGGSFSCANCRSLKSLEGAPEEVGSYFSCSNCDSLKSLEGAPKKVGGNFYCYECGVSFTENDVKKVSKAKKEIFC